MEQELKKLEAEQASHVDRRRKALEGITQLTQQDLTDHHDELLDLAWDAFLALEDARDAKARWKALRDQLRPKCDCGCHS